VAITVIKAVLNLGSGPIYVRNIENPGDTGGHGNRITIPAAGPGQPWGSSRWTHDMWVPWAPTAHDFAGHHIEISADNGLVYYVWQAHMADGDGIRGSKDGWHSDNWYINGFYSYSGVGGLHALRAQSIGDGDLNVGMIDWPIQPPKPDGTIPGVA
jgi:hypothetical protein